MATRENRYLAIEARDKIVRAFLTKKRQHGYAKYRLKHLITDTFTVYPTYMRNGTPLFRITETRKLNVNQIKEENKRRK